MSRIVTLLGYAVIAIGALTLDLAARRSSRLASFGDLLAVVLRRRFLQVLVLAGWVWLGWHLFVRVNWR